MTRELAGLRTIRGVLFDMDGVIYVGARPLPGVQEAIDYLTSTGRAFLFVTNNASKTPEQFVERLAEMDIHVRPEQVLGSTRRPPAGWPGKSPIMAGRAGRSL